MPAHRNEMKVGYLASVQGGQWSLQFWNFRSIIYHPSFKLNYPEPIRIWPVGSNNGKENVFFNFNPAMDRDWILEPGNDYQLKYRMFVYDGKIEASKAESLWHDFAFPPKVSVDIVDE